MNNKVTMHMEIFFTRLKRILDNLKKAELIIFALVLTSNLVFASETHAAITKPNFIS